MPSRRSKEGDRLESGTLSGEATSSGGWDSGETHQSTVEGVGLWLGGGIGTW